MLAPMISFTFKRRTTRNAIVVGSVALKFARHQLGARCNRYEADLYRRTTSKRRELLCPVIWCSANGKIAIAKAATAARAEDQSAILARMYEWDYNALDDEGDPFEPKIADWGPLERQTPTKGDSRWLGSSCALGWGTEGTRTNMNNGWGAAFVPSRKSLTDPNETTDQSKKPGTRGQNRRVAAGFPMASKSGDGRSGAER